MKKLNEYSIRIRTEKHGVYRDHGPFSISSSNRYSAISTAMKHLNIRIQRIYKFSSQQKMDALKNVAEDTIGSEVSIIATRIR